MKHAILCVFLAPVILMLAIIGAGVWVVKRRKPAATVESEIVESYDEDFGARDLANSEELNRPDYELAPDLRIRKARRNFARQSFLPTSPKLVQSWNQMQRGARN